MDSNEESACSETKAIHIHDQIEDCQEDSKDSHSCQESEEAGEFQEKEINGCYQKVPIKEDYDWCHC